MKYWEFFIYFKTLYPYLNISWKKWKFDSIYKEMAKFVKKTSQQCKSKDQNMRRKFLKQGFDVLEVALKQIKSCA